ncbi:fad binding domain containing protein [Diaporthe amygdali]|uniref:fad binding domain containing protein n=1 Tax=Phomopsis amygdali TaxID=1214568 RepID=UPI0022FEB4AF|nr:fad binding domain containing protein [Diaporthe amygdali]KAJ0120475.1 fad binding domain containing protein [Diaporthe amygdali]
MLSSLLFSLAVASSIKPPFTSGLESADFNVTQALIEQGVNVSAIPALGTLTDQSSVFACNIACQSLQAVYGYDAVELKDEANYANFTGSFWSKLQAEVHPHCIFYPSSASAVSVLVLISRLTQCPFAVKSGGHAAFAGASSIEGGVTVSLKKLDSIALSADRKTVFIQPGNTWGHIYGELANYDLSVIGGRVAPIGIGGLTTGGGISFFSNIYGFACDNVASYEVVTSTGEVITASPRQHPDLYWALRGGGNNFGVVVNFELETISLPKGQMWGASRVYMEEQFPKLIDAFAGLIDDSPTDPNAGTWVAWILNSGAKLASAELWYAQPNGHSSIFENFNRIPAVSDSSGNRSLANYTAQVAERNPYGYRECYYATSIRASRAVAQAATDIFFEEVVAVSDVPGANPVMVWKGITEGLLNATKKHGGNPLGLSAEDGPFYLIQLSCWWENEEDDPRMYRMISTVLKRIKAAAVSEGVQNDWVYMNYASQFQDVISSYGAENKAALKSVAAKYDPTGVFQRLQPGYFKLDRAPVPDSGYFSF